jgi:hypothetical protein
MNSKLLLILPLMICLSACAGARVPPRATCLVIAPSASCGGDKHFPIITINTQAGLVVDRSNACATPGSTIEFRVVPPGQNDVGSVSIRAKDPGDTWLNGSNSPNKMKIEILVPDWVTTQEKYDYAIYTSGGTCMDPRVEVLD